MMNEGVFIHSEPFGKLSFPDGQPTRKGQPSSDSHGIITTTLEGGQRIYVVPNVPGCESSASSSQGFVIRDILIKGIVSINTCGNRAVPATPGELTIFIRPRNLFERILSQ